MTAFEGNGLHGVIDRVSCFRQRAGPTGDTEDSPAGRNGSGIVQCGPCVKHDGSFSSGDVAGSPWIGVPVL